MSFDGFVQPPTRQEVIKDIAWSYTKRGLFEQCQRRYYYKHFGAAVALAEIEPQHVLLRQLKALQGRHERIDKLLHLGVVTYLNHAQEGTPMSDTGLVEWLLSLFRQDCDHSRADPDGTHPLAGRYPPVLLLEYYYREPDVEQLMAESAQHLQEATQAFLSAPVFAPFRTAGMRPGAIIEQPLSIPGFPCKIGGRLDLAFVEDGQVIIVDWKSGGNDGSGTESLQLAAYTLWARTYFQVDPEAIQIYKAHLRDAALESFPVTERLLYQFAHQMV